MYYVYMLCCADGSYYTGLTNHLGRRMQEHAERGPRCARYTRSHPVKALAGLWCVDNRSAAARLEYAVKQLPRAAKQELLAAPERAAVLVPGERVRPLPAVTLEDCLSGRLAERE